MQGNSKLKFSCDSYLDLCNYISTRINWSSSPSPPLNSYTNFTTKIIAFIIDTIERDYRKSSIVRNIHEMTLKIRIHAHFFYTTYLKMDRTTASTRRIITFVFRKKIIVKLPSIFTVDAKKNTPIIGYGTRT